jgi:hypothetical protein
VKYSFASPLVEFGIPALAVLVAGLFVGAAAWAEHALGEQPRRILRRAAFATLGVSAWAGIGLVLAAHGVLARLDARPPPLLVLLVLTLLGAVTLGRSSFGERLARGLPLWALVLFAAFRLPLELLLHRAAVDGVMPIEMSFSGYNFDIVSGVTAMLVALALPFFGLRVRGALRLVAVWNALGLLLLGNIVVIAVAATPVFHAFGPQHLNVWITRPPFVLLPQILVMAALFDHVLVFRKLGQLRAKAGLGNDAPPAGTPLKA